MSNQKEKQRVLTESAVSKMFPEEGQHLVTSCLRARLNDGDVLTNAHAQRRNSAQGPAGSLGLLTVLVLTAGSMQLLR